MPGALARVTLEADAGRYHQWCVATFAGHSSRSGPVLNYPPHWAGLGLLLLRGTVGITVAMQAGFSVASTNIDRVGVLTATTLVVCGAALTLGILTRVCSTLVGLGYALVLFMPFPVAVLTGLDGAAAAVTLAAAAALALLGPGAFSIDARLFGRREIFIPATDGQRSPPRDRKG